MRFRRGLLAACLLSISPAGAIPIPVGTLSFTEFIAGAPSLPGINAFEINNFTDVFAIPPDFPLTDKFTFQSASLDIYQGATLWSTFSLGDIGPGPALDLSGNPLVQVSGDLLFTSARLTAISSSPLYANIDVTLAASGGLDLAPGVDSVLIYVDDAPATGIPEPSSAWLLFAGLLAIPAVRKRVLVFVATGLGLFAQTVTLTGTTSPAAGQPGVTTMSVTGSGFPAGAIVANQVVVAVTPITAGPAMTGVATAIATVAGTTRRVTFTFTGANVGAPAAYRVSVSGPGFTSANAAAMTVNPAALIELTPASSGSGRSQTVAIAGNFTNFLNGSTRANFGPGIAVGGGVAGAFGPVTVTSAGAATAQLVIAPGAQPGGRIITVATGVQQASATFTVINQAPAVNAGPDQILSLPSSATLSGSVTDDGFPVGRTLTAQWSKVSGPGTVTFGNSAAASTTATFSAAGAYVLRLTGNDSVLSTSDDIGISVNAASNAVPVITSSPVLTGTLFQAYSYNVAAMDANNDPLTYSLTVFPSGMTIHATTGAISWTPPGTGALNVTVQVSDGKGGTATQTFVVNVPAPPNAGPVLSAIPNRTINVGDSVGIRLTANDPNFNDLLQYSLLSGPSGSGLNPAPLLKWTAGPQHIGTNPFQARVQDPAGLFDTKSFNVQVLNTNAAPLIAPQADGSVQAGAGFSRILSATDPNPGDTLTFSLINGPAGLTVASGGQVGWSPTISQYGVHKVKALVTDSGGLTDATQFFIDVGAPAANYPPRAVDDRYAVRRGTTLTTAGPGVLGNDTDPNSNPLNARLIGAPSKGSLNLAGNGGFSYTPAPPPSNSTEPKLKFGFVGEAGLAAVYNSPLVVDLDRDGVAEIAFIAWGAFGNRRFYAVNGATGVPKFVVNGYVLAENVQLSGQTEMAAGDLDGDGFPEILVISDETIAGSNSPGPRRRIIAYNGDGTRKWMSPDLKDGVRILETAGPTRIVIANVTGDSRPEIILGHSGRTNDLPPGAFAEELVTILNHLGQPISTTRTTRGGNADNLTVADIDLDGLPEILHYSSVITGAGTVRWSIPAATLGSVQDIAVANFDDDPFAEIIYLDYSNQLHCFEHTGVRKWGPVSVPVGGGTLDGVSLLTIGDADGNGTSEILIVRGNSIQVFGGNGALQRSIPLPYNNRGGNATIFDLNGDGKPEIIHHSAQGPFDTGSTRGALTILDGPTGTFLHSIKASRTPNAPGSIVSPIVADVDGDGAVEIVVGQWDEPGEEMIRVFEANSGHWMPGRPVANQMAYSVTNVNADGTIPASPLINWLTPGLNSYRVFTAPPAERVSDLDQFTYVANDGSLDSNIATVRLDILPPNTAPRFISKAPTAATPGIEYLYAARAADPDPSEVLVYSLAKTVSGMTIDSVTGLIRWTPGAGQLGTHVLAVKVADSQGLTDYEGFMLIVGPPVTVPNVVGQTEASARSSLIAAGLVTGSITGAPSATRPAGQVISHEPAAGAAAPSGGAVNLVISTGPAAVPVPGVAGKTEITAMTLLTQSGFGAAITRVFSNTLASGVVISQNPAPGTLLVPGSVAMTISAGSGLSLRLSKNFTTADVSIPFTVAAHDLNGVESAAPPLQFSVVPSPAPLTGTLPTVGSSTIIPALNTRGAFRLTATDTATGRSVYADFAVTFPRVNGQPSMMDVYTHLASVMSDIDELIRQGRAARLANNTAQVNVLLAQMVTRWRQVDRSLFKFAVPFTVENGFPAQASQLAQFGLTATAEDALILKVLRDAEADLKLIIEAHRAPLTPLAQLSALYDQFSVRASRLNGLNLSMAGAIKAQSLYALLLSHRIPDLYDALMNDVGRTVGLLAKSSKSLERQSTLAELATTTVMDFIIEKIMDNFNKAFKNAKEFATDIMKQAAWGGAAVAAAQAVRSFVHGQNLAAVVSGASLSFRIFEAPFTMIEGDVDPDPELNTVVMIGPDIAGPLLPWFDRIKDSMNLNKPPGSSGAYASASSVFEDLKGLNTALDGIANTGQAISDAIRNAFQNASAREKGCIFSNSPTCGELLYPDGFKSVYTYIPPCGFQSFSGLPVPIIFMVYNKVSSVMYFDTPPFLPFKPPPPPCN